MAIGPATKAIMIATAVLTIVFQLTESRFHGLSLVVYDVPAILHLQLWRIVTYSFFYYGGRNLVFGLIYFFFMARWFEATYGTRDFVRFFAWSSLGAGFLALPLNLLINASGIIQDVTIGEALGPASDAMMMALALNNPNSNILMGFVLPVRVRTAIIAFLSFRLVIGILDDGAAALSMSLAGLAMGYLLVTGKWRPNRWFGRGFSRRNRPRIRSGLYIVPPKHDDTLH
ncbi:MAG: rhomboid family intramembrane serine protease [Myxococcota bacterium]|nr:rhomboid family intramembrane serine protease [Myxococcota bacterium]